MRVWVVIPLSLAWGVFWALVAWLLSTILDTRHLWPGVVLAFVSTTMTFLDSFPPGPRR